MSAREPYTPDPAWVAETVTRTRAEQGLPPTVGDPLVYERVAALVGPWLDEQTAEKPASRARSPQQAGGFEAA